MKNIQLNGERGRPLIPSFVHYDVGRFIAQRTIVEGHQCFEHVRFAAEHVVDGTFDPMFEQSQDPITLIF